LRKSMITRIYTDSIHVGPAYVAEDPPSVISACFKTSHSSYLSVVVFKQFELMGWGLLNVDGRSGARRKYLGTMPPPNLGAAGAKGGRIEATKVSSGTGHEQGCRLPSRLGGLGERRELTSGVRVGAPAVNAFWSKPILKVPERFF